MIINSIKKNEICTIPSNIKTLLLLNCKNKIILNLPDTLETIIYHGNKDALIHANFPINLKLFYLLGNFKDLEYNEKNIKLPFGCEFKFF
jgi:hypothetical protein